MEEEWQEAPMMDEEIEERKKRWRFWLGIHGQAYCHQFVKGMRTSWSKTVSGSGEREKKKHVLR